MKKLLFIVLLVAQCYITVAQPYQSIFGNNSTEWVYTHKDEFGNHNDTAFVLKDTLVNNKTYKLVVESYYYKTPWLLVREDADTVWCRSIIPLGHPDDTVERILMRMDLDIGDTFDISNFRLPTGSYPDSFNIVDSIINVNGLKHIYFKGLYAPPGAKDEPYTIIEGVGPNMGIFWKFAIQPTNFFSGGYYLLCSYKDGIQTPYQNRKYAGACWMFSNSERLDELGNDISLYPQPASGEINISNNTNHKITKAIIISPTGTILKQYSGQELIKSINIEDVSTGFYFIKLFTSNGNTIVKSMIIK